ncbi:MAG TPA: peptide ABC transporter substrate-binding protein [Ktedonobacterales bacterium]|nr:peptide ABC transporter substrate-binding protein [Ktedonobacterales bacterium]
MRCAVRRSPFVAVGLLLCVVATILAGCQTSTAKPKPTALPDSQQILRAPLVGQKDVSGLDPATVSNANSLAIMSLIYPGLVTLNANQQVIPWAADGLPDISEDGLTYTFHVRAGLKWSDGTPINAQTFAYSLNRALSPCVNSPVNYYLFGLKDAVSFFTTGRCASDGVTVEGPLTTLIGDALKVTDQQTLEIVLAQPAAYFLDTLSYPVAYAVPQQTITKYGSDWTKHLADGSGLGGSLYMLTAWPHNGTLTLTRNPNFWGANPLLREIDYTFYPTADNEYAAWQADKSDVGYAPTTQYPSASAAKDFHETGMLNLYYFAMSWTEAPFNNLLARQAFALALDKQAIATDVLKNTVIPTNHIVPQGMPGYNAALRGPDGSTHLTGDPAIATKYGQQYANVACHGKFATCATVVLTIPSGQSWLTSVANTAVAAWKKALPGWPISIRAVDQRTLLQQLGNRQPQLWLFNWLGDYPDPQDWLSLQFLPGSDNNIGNVTVDQANTLMLKADAEVDPLQRMRDYNAAEQLLVVNIAWIPLYQTKVWWQTKPTVRNYALTSFGLTSLDVWPTIYIAAA